MTTQTPKATAEIFTLVRDCIAERKCEKLLGCKVHDNDIGYCVTIKALGHPLGVTYMFVISYFMWERSVNPKASLQWKLDIAFNELTKYMSEWKQ